VLLVGSVAFTVIGLVGAGAQEVVQLVSARGLQGAAAAISVPSALRLLLDAAPEPDERRGALAAWSASGAAAGALGLLVGGVLTDVLGWRSVFWVNVPVGILLVAAIRSVVPRSEPDRKRPGSDPGRPDPTGTDPTGAGRAGLDLTGAALLTGAVMALIVGASLVEDPHRRVAGALLAAAGLATGAGFLVQQRRAVTPLVPRAAFASANLRTGSAVSFVNTATTSSTGVLATLLLQREFGVSATGAGLALVPFSLGVIAGSALTGPLGARLAERRLATAGLGGIAVGNLALVLSYGSVAGIVAGVLVAGAGLGIASVAGTAIGTAVADDLSGTASGVLNTSAQVGTAIGVAALFLLASGADGRWPGTAVAWAAAAGIAGLTALVLLARDGDARTRSRPPDRLTRPRGSTR
jgi:MFS family permease